MGLFSLFSRSSRSSSGRYRDMHRRGSHYYKRGHKSSNGILGSLISSIMSAKSWSSSRHRHHRHHHKSRSIFSLWS